MKRWRKWLEREDDFLRKYYGKWHSMQIANALGRPQKGVWNRAAYLKLAETRQAVIKEEKAVPIKKPIEEKIVGLARHYDLFGLQLAIFCVQSITVHRCTDG